MLWFHIDFLFIVSKVRVYSFWTWWSTDNFIHIWLFTIIPIRLKHWKQSWMQELRLYAWTPKIIRLTNHCGFYEWKDLLYYFDIIRRKIDLKLYEWVTITLEFFLWKFNVSDDKAVDLINLLGYLWLDVAYWGHWHQMLAEGNAPC